MKSAVIRFPGSNCERDSFTVLESLGMNPEYVWHEDSGLPDDLDLIVIPGGFTYGDYLRVGAMAANAPIMREVAAFAESGGFVLGICNGFQILCEAGLLPGTLMKNNHLKFSCKNAHLKVEHADSAFTSNYAAAQVIEIPIAHHDGSYFATPETLADLEANDQILFRYCDAEGMLRDDANPNGSVDHIAGICNKAGNVMGMMPHPERHADAIIGGTDGRALFESLRARAA
jgi:phosphoribosylformylglycinamidine synthase I